jgi:hypothetical protein
MASNEWVYSYPVVSNKYLHARKMAPVGISMKIEDANHEKVAPLGILSRYIMPTMLDT